MAFAWKMLIPLALINIVVVATEILIWREFEITDWILVPPTRSSTSPWQLAWWASSSASSRAGYYGLPRRVILMHDISVPSLPAPALTSTGSVAR